METDKKHMVRGESALDGKIVEGYFIRANEDNAYIAIPTDIPFSEFDFIPIEPASVEPVRAAVLVQTEEDREYVDYICPNCKDIIDQRRKGQETGFYTPSFHAECGMALDWTESSIISANMEKEIDKRFLCRGKAYDEWAYGYVLGPKRKMLNCIDETGEGFIVHVSPETVGQCTGILAVESYRGKDEMERMVFEGDIIRTKMHHDASFPKGPGYYNETGTVVHWDGYAGYALSNEHFHGRLVAHDLESATIMGTIHDATILCGGG